MQKVSLLLRDDGVKHHLEKTLKSIYAQSYPDLEILLFSEKKEEIEDFLYKSSIFQPCKGHTLVIANDKEKELSLYAQTNMAEGDWVSCLMAGEEMFPERIEKQVNFLKKHKHYNLIGCWYFIKDSNEKIIDVQKPHPFHITLSAQLIGSWTTKEIPVLAKKTAIPNIKKISHFPYWFYMLNTGTMGCLDEYLACIPEYLQIKNLDHSRKKAVIQEWGEARLAFLKNCEDKNVKRRLLKRTLLLFPHDKKIFNKYKKNIDLFSKEEKTEDDTLFLDRITCLNSNKYLPWNEISRYYDKKGKNTLPLLCCLVSLSENPKQPELLKFLSSKYLKVLYTRNKQIKLSNESGIPVSVIMPTFNRVGTIKETLDSLARQDFKDFEAIVVNDGGTHEVEKIIKASNDKRFKYHWIPHMGRSGALNFGMEKAEGKYFAYIGDDDIFYPSHLSTLYNEIIKNKSSFAYTKNHVVKGYRKAGEFYDLKHLETKGQPFNIIKNYSECLASRLVMHHRSLPEKLGGFDEELQWGAYWDLWLTYCRNTNPTFIDIYTADHRRTNTNITTRNAASEEFYIKKLIKPFFLSGYGIAIIIKSAIVNKCSEIIDECIPILKQPQIYVADLFKNDIYSTLP